MIEALAFDLTKPPPAIVRPDAYWMTRMGDVHDRQKFLRLKSWQQAAVMMERDRIGPLIGRTNSRWANAWHQNTARRARGRRQVGRIPKA